MASVNSQSYQYQFTAAHSSTREPVTLLVAFAPKQWLTVPTCVVRQQQQILSHQVDLIATWPDGSLRVLHVHCVPASPSSPLQLELLASAPTAHAASPQSQVTVTGEALELQFGSVRQQLSVQRDGHPIKVCSASLQCAGPVVERWSLQLADDNRWLSHQLQLDIYPAQQLVRVNYSITNSQRALHPGGLWDLGDAGSVQIQGLQLQLAARACAPDQLQLESAVSVSASSACWTLSQHNSGMTNWQSENHVDATGATLVGTQGYQWHDETEQLHGRHASPVVRRALDEQRVLQLVPCEFWQNFPAQLSATKTHLQLGWFSKDTVVELQGGERKSWHCWLDFAPTATDYLWQQQASVVTPDPLMLERSAFMPWFGTHDTDPIKALLTVHDPVQGFVAKRALIDEFGWRNYGDIVADHESLYLSADQPLYVSHYNNQYDPIYGLTRQYLLSGDARWFALLDPLARHVSDIDIYHTDADKAEYNHGLFWHTDHYLPAHTSTHRTYSKHNKTSSVAGQTGGGPANEHCYSTGLMYHYFLTGAWQSKAAVLGLAQWMINAHESSPGLLSRLWSIKTLDVPKLKAAMKGGAALPYRYPFTRGTGNYLNTLLDAWEISGDARYEVHINRVLRQTLHPNDDVELRDLLDVETRWSYLVLIGFLPRYIRIKALLDHDDEHYQFALASFYRYASWMRQHERMFLSAPEILEFPNDTWTAQDLRKVMIMFQAAQLFNAERAEFEATATTWLAWICQRLTHSQELSFARIQILLMLNYGPHLVQDPAVANTPQPQASKQPAPRLTVSRVLMSIGKKLLKGVVECRPSRERHWLKTRMNRL